MVYVYELVRTAIVWLVTGLIILLVRVCFHLGSHREGSCVCIVNPWHACAYLVCEQESFQASSSQQQYGSSQAD